MKDPAFLFYSDNFLSGTMFMSAEQVGKYIRLLCAQHLHGHLSKDEMQSLCGGIADAIILEKFNIDENGRFFNERLEMEVGKRREHSIKQSLNAKKRWNGYSSMPPQCDGNAVAMPLCNGNKIEVKSNIETKKEEEVKEKVKKEKEEKKPPSQDYLKFIDWLTKNAPRVLQMKEPFTEEQVVRLKKDYNSTVIRDILLKMHNYKKLLSNNINSNLTFRNWVKMDEERGTAKIQEQPARLSYNIKNPK